MRFYSVVQALRHSAVSVGFLGLETILFKLDLVAPADQFVEQRTQTVVSSFN